MNTHSKYVATVIIPCFNRGDVIHLAFDSLLEQTIDFSKLQVLIVNDGSTDDSLEICRKMAQPYDNVFVLDKPNGGLSSTRNYGLDHAEGKYIVYLDDDDALAPETIEEVTNFFDTVYDEVDLVTYKIARYSDGKKQKWNHFRYRYLKETGVYDLNECPMVLQTTINVVVKNMFKDNQKFDTEVGYMEDQVYNNAVLSKKFKIGYCSKGEYRYNRHLDSIVSSSTSAYNCFEKMIKYFEDLFGQYDEVPPYIQCSLLHNLSYRMKDNILFPYHYNEEDFAHALDRISALLARVDEVVLYNRFPMDDYHRTYFLSLKKNRTVQFEYTPDEQILKKGNIVLMRRNSVSFVVRRFYFDGNKIRFIGYIRTPFFYFEDKPKLYLSCSNSTVKEITLKKSSFSYYYCEHECARNWSFDFTIDCSESFDFSFVCKLHDVL